MSLWKIVAQTYLNGPMVPVLRVTGLGEGSAHLEAGKEAGKEAGGAGTEGSRLWGEKGSQG